MAYSPVGFINPQYYTSYANWWLKGYQQATTTPLSMATDSSGLTQIVRAEITSAGFIKTSGGALFTPHFNQAYDIWIFPTAAEADANDTTNAIQVADDLWFDQSVENVVGGRVRLFANVAAMVAATDLDVGSTVQTSGYFSAGDGGGNTYDVVSAATGTDDGGTFIDLAAHQAQGLFPGGFITDKQYGTIADGVTDDSTALSNAYAAHSTLDKELRLLGNTIAVGSTLVWGNSNDKIIGAGKKTTVIKRLPSIVSTSPTINITPGNFGQYSDFRVNNDSQDGDGIFIQSVNESSFSRVNVDNVSSGYAWTVKQASSNNFRDCFAQNVDKILRAFNVSNQCDFYDFGGVGLSTTEAALKIENCFRTNFFGGIVEHDGRGIEIGSDIDGIAFYGYYCESRNTSAALSDVLIGETTGGNSNTVALNDCYITQNANKGAPNVEITGDARNVRIAGGRLSRSVSGTDDLINVSGNPEFVTVENIDTFTISAVSLFNAATRTIRGLRLANLTDINANATIDVGNANGCSMENIQMAVTVGASATRVSAQGITSNSVTDASGKVRYLAGDGLNDFGQAVLCIEERSDPGASPANNAYIFSQDNGAGKTQVAVRFPTGAIQIIATEP